MIGSALQSARIRWALLGVVALVLMLTKPFSADAQSQSCGTKTLYGKALNLYIGGKGLTCDDVAKITKGDECVVDAEPWFCFAPQTGPALVWIKDKERFNDKLTAWVEARRLPCSQSAVSAADWARARTSSSSQFPTEQQLLADDLIRCKQLKGKRYAAVRAFLGKPDAHTGRRELDYQLGPERDSMFQLDSEALGVRFTSKGVLKSIGIYQT